MVVVLFTSRILDPHLTIWHFGATFVDVIAHTSRLCRSKRAIWCALSGIGVSPLSHILHVNPSTSHQLIDNHVVMGRHTTIMARRPAVIEKFPNLSHRGTPSELIFPNHKQSKKKAIIVIIQKLHENDHLHGNCLPMRLEDAPTWQTQSDGRTRMKWTGPPTSLIGLLDQICLFKELDEIRNAPGINHLV